MSVRTAGRPSLAILPTAWGRGYAAEACAAALDWFADAFPDEPVALCTQTANDRSIRLAAKLGFTEVGRFEAWRRRVVRRAVSGHAVHLSSCPGSTTDLRGRRSAVG